MLTGQALIRGGPRRGHAFNLAHFATPLEISKVRERLRESEPLLVGRAEDREERPAHRIGVALRIADRIECRAKPIVVMREDLIDAAREIVERIAVRGKHTANRQGPHGAQRTEKIAERVIARVRIEAHI